MIVGDVTKFIKATISMTTTHYPARGETQRGVSATSWEYDYYGRNVNQSAVALV